MTRREYVIRTPLFPDVPQLAAIESQKARLENDGWTLTKETPAGLWYEKESSDDV